MEPKGLAVWTRQSSDTSPGWSSSTRFSMRRMFFQVGSPERGHLQSPPGLCAWAQWAGGATVLGHDQPGDSSQARDSALGTPLKEGWQCVGKHPASRPPGQLNLIPHTSTDDLHGTEPTGPPLSDSAFPGFLPPTPVPSSLLLLGSPPKETQGLWRSSQGWGREDSPAMLREGREGPRWTGCKEKREERETQLTPSCLAWASSEQLPPSSPSTSFGFHP